MSELALDRLRELVTEFDRPDTPYTAMRRGGFNYHYDDYEHLARVAEWAAAEAEGGSDRGGGEQ
jgi:ATP-dependent helicase/nuclease subunit B